MTAFDRKTLKSLKDSNEEAKRKINLAKSVFKVKNSLKSGFLNGPFPIGPQTFDQSERGLQYIILEAIASDRFCKKCSRIAFI